ncbi:MAG TPA: hypothetical protein PK095_03090 [Myxococcota bacterium]|nr:hypothetical protein [Myxococcota bacterium]
MACRPIPAMEEVHWSPFSDQVGVGFGAGSTGLYVTHDGGASWRREPYNWDTRFPSAASGFTPSQVVFLDAEHWVVTGAITRGAQANLTIISRAIGTRNGGLSFTPIFEGSDDTTEVAYPQDTAVCPFGQAADGVFKIDEQRLVAVARGLLFGSVDGGQTFHTVRIFGRWGRWEPSDPRLGLSPGEEVNWQVIHPDGLGLVFHPFGVAVTRDAGLSFEVLDIDSVRRAWLDPLGRVLVWPAGSESRTIQVFEKRDGLWYRRPLVSASARVEDILRFDSDGSFVARLEGQGSLKLARFEIDGDDHTVRELDIEAGLPLREVLGWSTSGGRERLLVRGTGAGAETRAVCEVGEPPVVGRTMRRVLFIDPATREVRRWQELAPFDDGEGGYSDGDIYRLTALGELVFAATGLGTADLSAAATLGPGQLQVGLPGLGVPLENGTYYYLIARRPIDGQHQIGRASLYDGTLPLEGCEDCLSYPGLIQAFAVAPTTSEGGDELVYVLDRRRARSTSAPSRRPARTAAHGLSSRAASSTRPTSPFARSREADSSPSSTVTSSCSDRTLGRSRSGVSRCAPAQERSRRRSAGPRSTPGVWPARPASRR